MVEWYVLILFFGISDPASVPIDGPSACHKAALEYLQKEDVAKTACMVNDDGHVVIFHPWRAR